MREQRRAGACRSGWSAARAATSSAGAASRSGSSTSNLPKVCTSPTREAIAAPAIEDFIGGKVDSVYLVYNEFKSVMQQRVVVEQLLPIAAIDARRPRRGQAPTAARRRLHLRAVGRARSSTSCCRGYVEVQVLPGAARVERRVLRRADDGDGRRDAQLGRHDRQPDALHEQGASGGDHARDHRSRLGRRRRCRQSSRAEGRADQSRRLQTGG